MAILTAMATEVTDHGFGTTQYTTYAKSKINEAQQEIARKLRLRVYYTEQSYTATSGTNTHTLPTDFVEADYLYNDTDNRLLVPLTGRGLVFEQINGNDSGEPTLWLILGASIRLYPTPNATGDVLKLRYWQYPAAMADGDTPTLPTTMHHLLITYAVAKCYRREGDIAMHDAFMTHFATDLARAANDIQKDEFPDSGPLQVGGAWGAPGPINNSVWR